VAHVHLHDIAGLQRLGLVGKWGEVADAVVDRDASRESNTLLHLLLLLEGLGALLRDDGVAKGADAGDILAISALGDHALQRNCNNVKRCTT